MNDSHLRSLLKAISWRLFGTLSTMLAVYIFTHEWSTSFYVGMLEMLSKIILYYFHERMWIRFFKLSNRTY